MERRLTPAKAHRHGFELRPLIWREHVLNRVHRRADKGSVSRRFSSRSRRRAREMADRKRKRRRTPTHPFARRSALSRRRRIRERLGLILAFEWPGWRPRWPRLGDLGGQTEVSQRCVAPPTPARSARRAAATLRFTPIVDGRRRAYKFEGPVGLSRLVSGVIELPTLTGVASPTGTDASQCLILEGISDVAA